MNQWITNAKLIVTGLAAIAVLATIGYEWRYVWPAQKCEQNGAWWDSRDRQCLSPMPIWRITQRGGPPAAPVMKPKG